MDLRQLEYVVAVADELSFTRAAARCHIGQSGLSAQVAKLERELGAAVFDRTSRVVRLSTAGGLLVPRARRMLAEAAAARSEIGALSERVHGTLRLGVIPVSHGAIDLPALLATYHRRHPDVDVVVSDTGSLGMVAMVQAGELDVALLGLYPHQLPGGVASRVLSVEPLVAVFDRAHPCASRLRVDLRELAEAGPFIDCHHDSGLRTQVDLAFGRAGTSRHVAFELGNLLDVTRMAALGLGAAIVPEGITASLPADGGGVVARLSDPAALVPVTLAHRPAPSRAAAAFLALFDDA